MSEVEYGQEVHGDQGVLVELAESVYVTPKQKAVLERALVIPKGVTMARVVEVFARFLTLEELRELSLEAALAWRMKREKEKKG